MAIGDYTVADKFYVVNVVDRNIVFGFQWLFSIGEHSLNYQFLEMKVKFFYGKQVVLSTMNTYPKQLVSSHNMRSILKHE